MKEEKYENYQTGSQVKQQQMKDFGSIHAQQKLQRSAKQKLFPFFILMFLAGWISLSIFNNNYLLDKVIMGSVIIAMLLFIRAAAPTAYSKKEF